MQMMYERLIIMRELLSDNGAIYCHVDYRVAGYMNLLFSDIFGQNNFKNELIWCYRGMAVSKNHYVRRHDNIYFYSKTENNQFYWERISEDLTETTKSKYRYVDKNGRRFRLHGRNIKGSPIQNHTDIDIKWLETNPELCRIDYLDEKQGSKPRDWIVMDYINVMSDERVNYPTQKPEALLERIIKASSNEGDLVADFFCGSGTTGAVAEKFGRRWIMADLGRYAIHTTRKRLLGIDNCKPFVVQNLGKYERQYWQGVTFKKRSDEQMPIYEYIQFILKLYNAEPLTGMLHIHGKKGKHFVHVGAVDAPVTLTEIKEAMDEVKQAGQNALDILGWEWEMGLHDVVEKTSKESGIHLRLLSIPRDVMDPRAVEKGDVTFYELAYLEVEAKPTKDSRFVVELKDFAIPNLDLIPQEVRDKIKKWSDYIDYWSVDWDWNEDTFHNMWQSYRTRSKGRKLELTSDAHKYKNSGNHKIMVKVIDIFGNDTTHVVEVKS